MILLVTFVALMSVGATAVLSSSLHSAVPLEIAATALRGHGDETLKQQGHLRQRKLQANYCITGYIMDTFCISLQTLLDRPDLISLQHPDKHSVHCLIEVGSCVRSGYEVLGPPPYPGANYTREVKLDANGNTMAYQLAQSTGICSICSGQGTIQRGFQATVSGVLRGLGNPPILDVDQVVPASVSCSSLLAGNPTTPTLPPVVPTAQPTLSPPTTKPVTPTSKPVTPTTKPIRPTVTPIAPTAKPVTPTGTPTTKPVTPTTMPVIPTTMPVLPTAMPLTPTQAPVVVRSTSKPSGPPTVVVTVPFGTCFSERSTVQELAKGVIPIKDVKIGDLVKDANGNMVRVYSFGHYQPEVKTHYLQLHANGLASPIEMSRNHLVYVADVATPIPASLVSIGDKLRLVHGVVAEVTHITVVERNGAYAPFTTSGTILVNGVAASNYVTLQTESPFLMLGPYSTSLSMHWLSHKFQATHRFICEWKLEICQREKYSYDGISTWAYLPFHAARWLLAQNQVVVIAIFTLVCFVGLLLHAVELVYLYGFWLLAFAIPLVTFLFTRPSFSKSKLH